MSEDDEEAEGPRDGPGTGEKGGTAESPARSEADRGETSDPFGEDFASAFEDTPGPSGVDGGDARGGRAPEWSDEGFDSDIRAPRGGVRVHAGAEGRVTTLLTSEADADNPYESRYGIVEYLSDAVFVLQYVRPDDFCETRLAVEIQKIRDAQHSREPKPYEITDEGINVYRRANIF